MFCIPELCARNEYYCHIIYIICKIIERLWTVHVTYMRFADLFMVLLQLLNSKYGQIITIVRDL